MVHAEKDVEFVDDVDWIGRDYKMCDGIIDSAQRLSPNQFKEYDDDDLCIFSFYPTKPVGGICGGMVVSNNKEKIDKIRMESNFGEILPVDHNSWHSKPMTKGYQMFLKHFKSVKFGQMPHCTKPRPNVHSSPYTMETHYVSHAPGQNKKFGPRNTKTKMSQK